MIRIKYLDEYLIIDVSEHPMLLNGKHSLVLGEMGFQKDVANQFYVMEDPIAIRNEMKDLVTYFRRKNIPVETDDQTEHLRGHIQRETEAFQKAKELGVRVKKEEIRETLSIPSFKRTLKDYQVKAVRHLLAVENGANFSVPGSGKTTMLYAAYAAWKALGEVEKLLIIGPPSSFMAWEDEYTGCFEEDPVSFRLIGPDRERRYKRADQANIFLTSFQTAAIDTEALIGLMKEHKIMMIIDESHYIKRFENGIWANTVLRMAPYAKRRAISTGTPMPNGLLDLYTQMSFLWPGKQLFGERQRYKVEVKKYNDVQAVQEKIFPFFYRIKKSDLALPEPHIHEVNVPMSPIQRDIYTVLAAKTLGEMELLTSREISEIRRWRKAKMIRLLQASSNPALLSDYSQEFQIPPVSPAGTSMVDRIESYPQFEKPNKIIEAVKLVQELNSKGHKVLLWSTFVKNIFILKQDLERHGIPVYTVFGSVPKDGEENEDFNREQQIRSFRKSEKPCVLIANPAACAESISLHRECHHAVYLDRSFNCGHYLQSLDRIHRIGLPADQDTHYYFLLSEESIDEVIHTRLNEKADNMYSIIESDLPIGSMDLDNEEWNTDDELQRDFDAVLAQLRGMGR